MTPNEFVKHCQFLGQQDGPVDYKAIVLDIMGKARDVKSKPTYYLFGTDACQELLSEGEKSLLRKVKKEEIEYSTFEFIEGVTISRDLLEASDGWFEWAIITKELYEKLQQ